LSDPELANLSVATSLSAGTPVGRTFNILVDASKVSPGTYYWGAYVDRSNSITETDETNNALAGNTVQITTPQFLQLSVSPQQPTQNISRGVSVTYSLTVTDQNNAAVSGASVTGADNLKPGSINLSTSATGQSSYTTTAPTTAANCYPLTFTASKLGYQSSATQTRTVCILLPDIEIVSVVGPTGSATPTFTVDVNLRNRGNVATPVGTPLQVYLSADQTITTSDYLVASTTFSSIAAGNPHKVVPFVDVSAVPNGLYYWGAIADPNSTVAESDESNNDLAGGTFQWPAAQPDLTPTSISTSQSTWTSGSPVPVSVTTTNVGTGDAPGGWQGQVYLSIDQSISGSDIPICTYAENRIIPKQTPLTNTFSCSVPSSVGAGSYYLGVIVNSTSSLSEINLNNNRLASCCQIPVQGPPLPNLIVGAPTSSLIVPEGVPFSISIPVSNTGMAASAATTVEVKLNGLVQGTGTVPPISPGAPAAAVTVNVSALTAATYSGSATVDPLDQVPESNNNDNTHTFVVTVVQSGQLEVTAYDETGSLAGGGILVRLYDASTLVATVPTDVASKARFAGLDPTKLYRIEMVTPAPNSELWALCGPYTVPLNTLRAEACGRSEPWIQLVMIEKNSSRQDTRLRPSIQSDGSTADVEVTVRNGTSQTRDVELLASFLTSSGEYYGAGVRKTVTLQAGTSGTMVVPFDIPEGSETSVDIVLDVRATNIAATPVRTHNDATTYGFTTAATCDRAYRLEPVSSPTSSSGRDVILVHGYLFGNNNCSDYSGIQSMANFYWGAETGAKGVTGWDVLRKDLANNGMRLWVYRWPTYMSIEAAGNNLRELIGREGSAIAPKIVLVGHSMGGLASIQAFVSGSGLRGRVDRVVTLGSPHEGLNGADVVVCAAPFISMASCRETGVFIPGTLPPLARALTVKATTSDEQRMYLLSALAQDEITHIPLDVDYPVRGLGLCNFVGNLLSDCVVPTLSAFGLAAYPSATVVTPSGAGRRSVLIPGAYYGYDHGDIKWDWRETNPPPFDGGVEIASALQKLLLIDFGGHPVSQTLAVLGTSQTTARITSSPAGIDCQIMAGSSSSPSCTFDFASGTVVQLTVQGGADAVWTSGSPGFSCQLGPTCVVTMNVSRPVTVDVPPVSTSLAFDQQPKSTGVNGLMSTAVRVKALTAAGQIAANFTGTITLNLGSNPGGAALNGATAQAVAGMATFSNLTVSRVGAGYTLVANSTGLTSSVPSALFDVTARLAITTQPSNGLTGQPIAPPVTVTVHDANGVTYPLYSGNVALTLSTNPSGATLSGNSAAASNGVVSFPSLSIDKPGTGYVLEAAGPLASSATTFAFRINSSTHRLTVSGLGVGSGVVVSAPAGISCAIAGGTAAATGCVFDFPYQQAVTLTAQAGQLLAFGGDCAGTTCTVDMTKDRQVSVSFAGLDLVAGAVTVSPANPSTTQGVTVSATVTNSGSTTAGNVVWQLKVDGALIAIGTIPSLAPNDSGSVSAANLGPYSAGSHVAELVVDPQNAIAESNEANNSANQAFVVTGLPDLVAGPVSVNPAAPTDQQPVSVSATITNSGTTAANDVTWLLYVDATVVASGTVPSLAAGGSVPVSAPNVPPAALGLHLASLIIDTDNAINEEDEQNNSSAVPFTVGPTTYAEIVASPVAVSPATPTPSQSVTLSATVSNSGNMAATNVAWQLKVDGTVVGSGTIPSLAPNGASPVTAVNVGPYSAGDHTVELAVDPQNTIAEPNETNNTSSAQFTVDVPPVVDLLAGAVTVSPSSPATSQAVTLNATVSNAGNMAATNVAWQLKVDGTVVGSGTIPSLAPNGGAPVSVATTLGPYAAGSHTAELVVDPQNAIAETIETNNTSSQTFVVSPTPAVDLVAASLMVSPAAPTTGQTLTVTATVSNPGSAASTNVAWQMKVDGTVVGSGTILSLAPNGSAPVSAANMGPYAAGSHTAELVVDPQNAIAESDEGNNTTSQVFTVSQTPVVDLVAGSLTIAPPSPTTGQTVRLSSAVTNTSSMAAASVAWEIRVDGAVVGSGTVPNLAPNGSAPVSVLSLGPYAVGTYTVELLVDPQNAIAETNESNNISSAPLTVRLAPVLDLVAGTLTVNPSSPTTSQLVSLNATVINAGNTATDVAWQLKVDGGVVWSGTILRLAPNGSAPVSAANLGPHAAGSHTAELVVDPANAIAESNEGNNSASRSFMVSPTPALDLVAETVTVSPAAPMTTQVVTLNATVSNAGNALATNVAWQLTLDGTEVRSGTIPSLAPNGSAPVSAANLGPFPVGAHTVELVVDPQNALAESNEGNNSASRGFVVSPIPVLDLAAGTVILSPPVPTSSQLVSLNATVRNAGNTAATNVAWQLNVDGRVAGSGTISSLAPNGNASVSAANLGPYAAGTHIAELLVDPQNALAETNETNNISSAPFTVGVAPVVDLAAGTVTVTPANPTTSMLVTLNATVSNAGNTAASNVAWLFKVDAAVVGSGTIASLTANGSAPVSVTNLGPYAAGNHTAQLIVDPQNTIAETNKENNGRRFEFTVGLPQIDITTQTPLPDAVQGQPYAVTLAATGGSGSYTWSVGEGALPAGLELGRATGLLSGTPTAAGQFTFGIRVTSGGEAKGKVFSVRVTAINIEQVVDQVVRCLLTTSCELTEHHRLYVDSQGNRNSFVDVGDLLALFDKNPGISLSRSALINVLASPMADSTRIPVRAEKKP
jgi:subtilase family serine protease